MYFGTPAEVSIIVGQLLVTTVQLYLLTVLYCGFNPCEGICSELAVSFFTHFLDELFLLSVINQIT